VGNSRSIVVQVILAFCWACSGGGDQPTGPGTVASISVSAATSTSVFIGSTITLTATAFNSSGGVLPGQVFTWSSSNPLVATVSQTGAVTGVAAGTASISASIGSITGQTAVPVSASAAQLSCSNVTPLALNVGEVHQFSGLERSSLCIGGGAGSEYALVAFNSSLDTSTTAQAVSLVATGTVPAANAPSPQLVAAGPRPTAQVVPRDIDFEMRMREMERRELNPRFAAARAWRAGRSPATPPSRGISAILGVPSSPLVGSVISLNGNATSACDAPQPHGASVVAVSAHAIIAIDTLAPANGFTNADYQNFAAAFDTLIYPLDTLNYGAPTDIDNNNGRVLLFFSQLVNQLSRAGAGTYVGGFFFSRDLFPLTSSSTLAACGGSNVGEMFYLPVVDPAKLYNEFFKDKKTVTSQVLTTIVHEFQHLINAGRHLYVNTAAKRLEESWLDESQAMLAQELLYFRVSGFGPRQKLSWATISSGAGANGAQLDLVNAYLVQGLGALDSYLRAPETSTPYSNTENIATLGSGWQFMRYLLDNSAGPQYTFSRAIDDGVVTGFANLSRVFSLSLPALAATYQSWSIAQYVDGTGLSSLPAYANPSWNYRDVLTHALNEASYPLQTRRLLPGVPASLVLRGGAASFIRFRVNAGITAQIMPANGIAASTLVTYALVRTF
jgi:hypothetical protein